MTAVTGSARNPESSVVPHAAGARFSPMSATIVPVTTGGMTTSIHRAPATCTTTPTTASSSPVTRMPPVAEPAELPRIGAMNAKEDPR